MLLPRLLTDSMQLRLGQTAAIKLTPTANRATQDVVEETMEPHQVTPRVFSGCRSYRFGTTTLVPSLNGPNEACRNARHSWKRSMMEVRCFIIWTLCSF